MTGRAGGLRLKLHRHHRLDRPHAQRRGACTRRWRRPRSWISRRSHNIAELWGSGSHTERHLRLGDDTMDYTNSALIVREVDGGAGHARRRLSIAQDRADDLCGHRQFRPADSADHHADLRLHQRAACWPSNSISPPRAGSTLRPAAPTVYVRPFVSRAPAGRYEAHPCARRADQFEHRRRDLHACTSGRSTII